MTVRELISILECFNGDEVIMIDADENGWYDVENVEVVQNEDDCAPSVSIVSSNEA